MSNLFRSYDDSPTQQDDIQWYTRVVGEVIVLCDLRKMAKTSRKCHDNMSVNLSNKNSMKNKGETSKLDSLKFNSYSSI